MNLLLDTHTFLWWLGGDKRLPSTHQEAIADTDNSVFVSSATIWETAIKVALGRLEAPDRLPEEVGNEGFEELAVSSQDAWSAGFLPPHHQDPFDRMLAAQALASDFTLASVDGIFELYGVKVLSRGRGE